MEWLKNHVFIAAWAAPTIALIALVVKKRPEGSPMNWFRVMMCVGFLSGLAILVTPGVDQSTRLFAASLVAMLTGAFIVGSRQE
jgi:hypothetical protein